MEEIEMEKSELIRNVSIGIQESRGEVWQVPVYITMWMMITTMIVRLFVGFWGLDILGDGMDFKIALKFSLTLFIVVRVARYLGGLYDEIEGEDRVVIGYSNDIFIECKDGYLRYMGRARRVIIDGLSERERLRYIAYPQNLSKMVIEFEDKGKESVYMVVKGVEDMVGCELERDSRYIKEDVYRISEEDKI